VQLSSILAALCDGAAGDGRGDVRGLVNGQNHDGRTALHVVAARGQLDAVRTLLARAAAIDLQVLPISTMSCTIARTINQSINQFIKSNRTNRPLTSQ